MTYWSSAVVIWRGLGSLVGAGFGARRLEHLLFDDLLAEVDALVADVDALTRDQLADLLLALAAEAAAIGHLRSLAAEVLIGGACLVQPVGSVGLSHVVLADGPPSQRWRACVVALALSLLADLHRQAATS